MSLEPALAIIKVSFSKASNTYENGYLDHIRTVVSRLQHYSPEPRSSQHDLIRAMILDKKLKTYDMC
jgi:hypothetical protein